MNKVIIKNHLRSEIGTAVFASMDIQKGETIIQSRSLRKLPKRSKYSIESNAHHILIDKPGVLVNHSCTPNCILIENSLGAFDFTASKDIINEDEITWDYESIESTISAFEECLCGSTACRGRMNSDKTNP